MDYKTIHSLKKLVFSRASLVTVLTLSVYQPCSSAHCSFSSVCLCAPSQGLMLHEDCGWTAKSCYKYWIGFQSAGPWSFLELTLWSCSCGFIFLVGSLSDCWRFQLYNFAAFIWHSTSTSLYIMLQSNIPTPAGFMLWMVGFLWCVAFRVNKSCDHKSSGSLSQFPTCLLANTSWPVMQGFSFTY